MAHTHTFYKLDNISLFQLIVCAVAGHNVLVTIAPFIRTQDERVAYLAIVAQHAGRHVWDQNVKDPTAVLQTRSRTGATSITLRQHTLMHCKAYIQLTGAHQHVTYLLDLMRMVDPKLLAGIAAIEQDEHGKRINFEDLVTFLLPSDPVVAKNVKAKGLGVNVLATTANTKWYNCW